MAQLFELNSFVGKFVNLWQSGRNATLKLESQAGKASVILQLELGLQLPHQPVHGTSRDRRRQKRAEERNSAAAKAADIEAATADNCEAEEASGKIIENSPKSPNASVNGVVAAEKVVALAEDDALYELKIDASENCTEEDIVECFGINFKEALKDKKITDDRANFKIKKVPDKHVIRKNGANFSSLQIFRVQIRNEKQATDLVESFDEKNGAMLWDDLAFTNWKKNDVRNQIVVKDVKKIAV